MSTHATRLKQIHVSMEKYEGMKKDIAIAVKPSETAIAYAVFKERLIVPALKIAEARIINNQCECIECGNDIPESRTQVIPGALRCTNCQSAYEKRLYNV